MTSYAAVVSLMTTMKHIQSHPRLSFAFDDEQIEFLFKKLGFLLHHLKGNSHGGSKEEELECLIAGTAHAAEDIIESHIVDQIRAAGPISLLDLGSVLTTFDSPMKEVIEFEGSKNVELIGPADELIQPMERLLSSNDVHQATHPMRARPQITTAKNTTMIGFEEELNQLMEMLIGQQSSRQIIPIVGMGGIGKTTLAKSAYENQNSVDHFDIRAWATVSQNYIVRETLLQLLSIKGKSTVADIGTEEELGEKLYKKLCGRRYLIILDDLWSVEAWEKIMFFFPDNSNGSRVVVTTRLSNMGTYFASSCLAKKFLEADESWNLFRVKAFGQQGCPPELEEIGMEIAKKCKGLPLSITVIGGFLGKSPMTRKYWEDVAEDINSILNSGEDDEHCLNILSTSYIHLHAHLKPCFLYMGVFREDEEIRVSRLIKLWVSEGFLEPNEAQTLEDIAEGYVNDLVERNLIIASRWEVSGKIKTCNVHDLLRDLCLRIGEKEKFLRVIPHFNNFPQDMALDRRLVLPACIPDPLDVDDKFHYSPEYVKCFEALQSSSLTRSLLSPSGIFEALLSSSLTRSLLSPSGKLGFKLKLLRVLEKVDWAMELIDQVNLRYLSFFPNLNYDSYVKIDELPMWNLQTLICELDTINMYFDPLAIWEMHQLRHLEVHDLDIPEPDQQRGGLVLQNLQTLTGVENLRLDAEVCRRIPNVKTLGISYCDFSESFSDCCHCLGNLRQLHKLESLCLKFFCYSDPQPQDLMRKLSFPSALRKLTLKGKFDIRWEELTLFGCCPTLQVLKLVWCRFIGSEWSPVEGQFARLKKLKIEADENDLISWNADYTHFPVLEKLVLGRLHRLEEIPSSIGDISTLRHIFLIDPTDSTALSAVRILQDQLDNSGYEEFLVRVKFMSRVQLVGFIELMKSKSFTCKNVEFNIL